MSNLWNLHHLQGRADTVLPGDTVPAMFWNAVEQRADKVWLRQKALGVWRSWTWRECGETVQALGDGLLSLGVQTHDRCAILANTCREWVLSDLAIL
jgi:long-chain acyl-CoA synthetase